MLRGLLRTLVDTVIPPRASERVVRGLSLSQLQELMREDSLPYHDPRVTALIWELKYYGNPRATALCGALLSEHLLALAAEELGRPLLLPIPMHPARRKARGHNQTELLCQAALRHLGAQSEASLEYATHALTRVRDTPTQQGLERSKRLRNVRGSMVAHGAVRGRVCIVVDDVTTTDATLNEARRALRKAGARAVHTLALARS